MNIKLFLLTILLPITFAHASEPECFEELRVANFSQEVLNLLPGKICPSPDEVILKRVEQEYAQFYGQLPQVKKSVKGFNLTGSGKELKIANEMLGAKPPKNWAASAKDCATILCAFEKLFNSKEAAMQVFNLKEKSGYAMSLDQSINQGLADQTWSAKEVREMDAMISKLPKELKNLGKLKLIERMADGLRVHDHSAQVAAFASPAVSVFKKAELVSYDAGMNRLTSGKNAYETTSWPQEAIMHELCHHHDFKGIGATNFNMTSEKKNSPFKQISEWKEAANEKGESIWISGKDAQFVSWYSQTAPAEDYAESCMNYVLHPEKLKTKAPKKYAYMKANVFNNQEFTDMPWTADKTKKWPKLNDLLADESQCAQKLNECAKDITVKNGQFCANSSWSCGSAISRIQTNTCLKNFQTEQLKKISEELQSEEKFCDYDGQQTIEQARDKVCGQSSDKLAKVLEAAIKIDVNSQVTPCEIQNDYTSECVLGEALKTLNAPIELAPTINRILASSVPDRMSALADKLATTNTGTWLKACISGVSNITMFTTQKSGEKIYSYTSATKSVGSGYLGKHIYPEYEPNDINTSCGEQMLASLEQSGIKTPKTGITVKLMKKPFLDELRSFENEVLGQVEAATKKCLGGANCKTKKIMELLVAWEQKSPEKRAGFATDGYAEVLRLKFKN